MDETTIQVLTLIHLLERKGIIQADEFIITKASIRNEIREIEEYIEGKPSD